MKAFLFGAGASYGTLGCKAPVAAGFGAELAKLPEWKEPRGFSKLKGVVHHLGRPVDGVDLESVWTCIDYYDKLRGALPAQDWSNPSNRAAAVPDLKRALLMIYGARCDEEADNLPLTESYTLGKLLKHVRPGDALISLNYDALVERLAARFALACRVFCDELRRDVVNLVKPHGSTTWAMDFRDKTVTWKQSNGGVLLNSLDPCEVLRQREPLLLGAVPIKSELIEEVQAAYGFVNIFRVVMNQWRAVVDISRADLLVVVGYSFPKEDQYGRFVFREASRNRGRPLKIDYYERKEKRTEREASMTEAFPGTKLSIQWKGEVKGP